MPQRAYIDFKLFLTKPTGGDGFCQVSILPTPEVGETILPVTVPAENAPDPELLRLLAGKMITMQDLVKIGKQLSACMIPAGIVRDLFKMAYRITGNEGGIRLRLIFADHTLKQYPWEYAYLNMLDEPDSMRGFLLLDPRLSMVRHEPLSEPHPVLQPSKEELSELLLLIAAANPSDLPQLNVEDEIKYIETAIEGIQIDGVRVISTALRDATPGDLIRSLPGPGSANILHFAGHGTSETKQDWFNDGMEKQEGYIFLLADKDLKTAARFAADDLAKLLQKAGIRLAVIGGCYSGTRNARYPWDGVAGALTSRNIPAVIVMQYEIYDTHMIEFSKMFYFGLASGLSLDEAVSLGRQAMFGLNSDYDLIDLEWGVPVLYSRLPTGSLFPERMMRAGMAAERLRATVNQTIDRIGSTGKVTGISLEHLESGVYRVKQRSEHVDGILIGIEAEDLSEGSIDVNQDLGTVNGEATGITISDL